MYARKNGLKVKYPVEIDGAIVKSTQWIQGKSEQWRADNGITLHADPVMPTFDPDTQAEPVQGSDGEYDQPVDLPFEQAMQNKLNSFQQTYEQSMQVVRGGYSESEIASWDKQEKEARAWQADNNASTPFLDVLAQARGIAKSDLVAKVIAKADLATQYTAQQTGIRQALEDAIDVEAAKPEPSTAALRQITWPE